MIEAMIAPLAVAFGGCAAAFPVGTAWRSRAPGIAGKLPGMEVAASRA
jgi:hypothetical protein